MITEPKCTICNHPQRGEIEKELLLTFAYRKVAKHFGVSKSSLYRHAQRHLDVDIKAEREKFLDHYRQEVHAIQNRPHVREYQVDLKPGDPGYDEWLKRHDPFDGQDIDDLLEKKKEGPQTQQEKNDDINQRLTESDRKLINEFPPNVRHGGNQWPSPIRKRIIIK